MEPKSLSAAMTAGQAIGQARSLVTRSVELIAEASRLMEQVRFEEIYCLWIYLQVELSDVAATAARCADKLGRLEDSTKETVAMANNGGKR